MAPGPPWPPMVLDFAATTKLDPPLKPRDENVQSTPLSFLIAQLRPAGIFTKGFTKY